MDQQKLGRGLSALFGENSETTEETAINIGKIDINLIVPNQAQPRKFFDDEKIQELKSSILQHGVLQPIAVRKIGNNYEIIAGERRWRAAKLAGLKEIPVNILTCDDNQALAMSLVENIQRADLNPIEEAEAMKTIMLNCECTQNDLSILITKSRSYIANALRLLCLPDKVKDLIRAGRLTAGHGKILAGVHNASEIAGLAAQNNWNVRQLENSLKELEAGVRENYKLPGEEVIIPRTSAGTPIDVTQHPEELDLSCRIAEALKIETKLKITRNGGVVTLICKTCEQLEELTEKLVSLSE
ncbi:MAG: ParB/RepB/Spo0J family partition protein [Holosporales bacterium]|jgi:ParB family chromosome partitioning protein|nr:ParB/RepB/Spo0J family partition protein [Holosporales bacterium]